MRGKEAQGRNRFMRIITLPFRALGKAGDVYARGLTRCTGRGASHIGPAPGSLPRSFSDVSSTSRGNNGIANSEDFRELLRAASAKTLEIDVDVAARRRRGPNGLPKSCSVGMGMRRIDEDESCDFGNDEEVKDLKRKSTAMFSRRSRSYAVRIT